MQSLEANLKSEKILLFSNIFDFLIIYLRGLQFYFDYIPNLSQLFNGHFYYFIVIYVSVDPQFSFL